MPNAVTYVPLINHTGMQGEEWGAERKSCGLWALAANGCDLLHAGNGILHVPRNERDGRGKEKGRGGRMMET